MEASIKMVWAVHPSWPFYFEHPVSGHDQAAYIILPIFAFTSISFDYIINGLGSNIILSNVSRELYTKIN